MQKLQATTTASSLTSCPLNDQPTGGAATKPPPRPPPLPSAAVRRRRSPPLPSAAIQCRSRSSRCSKDLESKNQVRSWMGVGRKEGTRRKGRTIAAPTAVAKPARACVAAAPPARWWAALGWAVSGLLLYRSSSQSMAFAKIPHW